MRVFVTGATGWVGSAVVRQLVAAGHEVIGLVRPGKTIAAGATPLEGDLEQFDKLATAASATDAVIHTAFIHDFANFARSVQVDEAAIKAMGGALVGSGKPFFVTSGLALFPSGKLLTEEDLPDTRMYGASPRVSEETGMAFADQGVAAQTVRLPPTVHGAGDHGFVAALVGIARRQGKSGYIGTGENRWPAVHVEDAARAYVLGLTKGKAGQRHHAIAEQGVPFRLIAEKIGEKLGLPVVSVPEAEAGAHFGWMSRFAQIDAPSSSALTAERLGWSATGPTLVEDLDSGSYFGS